MTSPAQRDLGDSTHIPRNRHPGPPRPGSHKPTSGPVSRGLVGRRSSAGGFCRPNHTTRSNLRRLGTGAPSGHRRAGNCHLQPAEHICSIDPPALLQSPCYRSLLSLTPRTPNRSLRRQRFGCCRRRHPHLGPDRTGASVSPCNPESPIRCSLGRRNCIGLPFRRYRR